MTNIVIGKSGKTNVSIDLDLLLRTRLLIQANSGGGKSWLLRRIAEQLFGKVQVIIIDIEGEFATLREKFGFVLVGKGGETPADPRSASLVAHKLLELRASAVCDLYEMKASERQRWIKLFLDAMIDSPKALWHPVVVIIDEIHTSAPEKGSGESEAADAVIGLATRGRKRGFCLIGATQRLGKFRKDAAAELLNVLIGQTFVDVDVKRAAEALGVPRSEERSFGNELKLLEPGSFYALGRAITTERTMVRVGDVETTHPEMGSSKHAAEPPPAPNKIKALLPKLADLPKAAEEKAKTEAELRAEIKDLKTQIAGFKKVPVQHVVTKEKPVEVSVMKPRDIKRVGKFVATLDKVVSKLGAVSDAASGISAELRNAASVLVRVMDTKPIPAPIPVPVRTPVLRPQKQVSVRSANINENGSVDESMSKAERKILTVLAQFPDGCDVGKIALLSGYRRSGGFLNTLSSLRSKGYMTGSNASTMRITDEGVHALGPYDPLPTGDELVNYWVNNPYFGTCEKKALQALVKSNGGMTAQELANVTGYAMSGGFLNALSKLRTAGVIVGKNMEKMSPSPELVGM